MNALVGVVDDELVERVGAEGHVLWTGQIQQSYKGIKVAFAGLGFGIGVFGAETLVDVFVDPTEQERVERLGELITAPSTSRKTLHNSFFTILVL